jgi:hypothetical protein
MENFFRDQLAKELKGTRSLGEHGKDLAKDLIKEVRETDRYKDDKKAHIQANIDNKNPNSQKNVEFRVDSVRGEIEKLKLKKLVEKMGFESGPIFESMAWGEGNRMICELNEKLKSGEKPWRMIDEEDLKRIFEPCIDLIKEGKEDEASSLYMEIINYLGFDIGKYYWTATVYNDGYKCHKMMAVTGPSGIIGTDQNFYISGEGDEVGCRVKCVR